MYGTSYSGFNALQMACERPPALKGIVAIYASDDRYTDDVHYLGGVLKWLDLVDYCHYMTPMNALPPVPQVWGEGWREEWLARIDEHEPWLFTWLENATDGDYWRHGSVRPGYDRIQCPTMIVAGWADGYRNNSFRTMEALARNDVPRRLLAGPWAHASTSSSLPGPRIDLVPEMVRWWDRWLRGIENGIDDEPEAVWYVRGSHRPAPDLDTVPGYWRAEEWPSPRSGTRSLNILGRRPYPVRPDVGTDAWISCAGPPAVRPAAGPAPRRQRLAHLGLRRRRGRAGRSPGPAPDCRLRPAVRAGLGQALRRLRRRHVDPHHPRAARPRRAQLSRGP